MFRGQGRRARGGRAPADHVRATGTWEAGEAVAPLLFEGKPIPRIDPDGLAQLTARKRSVPFNLGLASAGDRSAPLGVTLDGTLTLVEQNDDALTYSVNWRLLVRDANGTGVAQVAAQGKGKRLVPGSNSLSMELPAFFPGRFAGLFRPSVVEGTLFVDYVDPYRGPTRGPPRSFALVMGLHRHHPDVCEWLCVGASFVLLLAGGLFSLGLNHGIPNAFRRLSLQRQLEPPLH